MTAASKTTPEAETPEVEVDPPAAEPDLASAPVTVAPPAPAAPAAADPTAGTRSKRALKEIDRVLKKYDCALAAQPQFVQLPGGMYQISVNPVIIPLLKGR